MGRRLENLEQFGIDVANNTLPRFAIIVPDGCYDNHDVCFGSTSLLQADDFLNSNLTPLLALSDFQAGGSGLLFITFDNGEGTIDLAAFDEPIDIILFGGEYYSEPIVAAGPFVMNTEHEISQAYNDFYDGKYGEIKYKK